jgi:hypothetical protein
MAGNLGPSPTPARTGRQPTTAGSTKTDHDAVTHSGQIRQREGPSSRGLVKPVETQIWPVEAQIGPALLLLPQRRQTPGAHRGRPAALKRPAAARQGPPWPSLVAAASANWVRRRLPSSADTPPRAAALRRSPPSSASSPPPPPCAGNSSELAPPETQPAHAAPEKTPPPRVGGFRERAALARLLRRPGVAATADAGGGSGRRGEIKRRLVF